MMNPIFFSKFSYLNSGTLHSWLIVLQTQEAVTSLKITLAIGSHQLSTAVRQPSGSGISGQAYPDKKLISAGTAADPKSAKMAFTPSLQMKQPSGS